METKELYYQVVEWNAKHDEFREVQLCKSEDRALSIRLNYERNAMTDAREDNKPNHRHYFVSILSEETVKAMKWKKYEQKLSEAREFFMSQYDGEFLPYCRQLVKKLASVLTVCTPTDLSDLGQGGKMLRIPEENIDSWTTAWLEVALESDGSVWLHGLIKRGPDDARKAIVNEFVDWEGMQKWLNNIEHAAKACEQKLIDSCIDTFQWVLNMPAD